MIKQLKQQGTFIVDIAEQIGCSEKTVSRHLAMNAPPSGRKKMKRPAKLDRFKPYIDLRLSQQVWNAEVIFHEIKEQGYTGGKAMLRRYIHPKRGWRESKKTVRFETGPGYQLQHDWGETKVKVSGQQRTVYFAVNTLGYSRRFHVFAAFKQDAEHTYQSLVSSFRYFGGSVKTVLVDNQKAAVIKHGPNNQVEFNRGFLELATHYGFMPRACKPRRARTKGKVERMVGYVKHHFFVRYREFDSLSHLQQLLEQWLAKVADLRQLRWFESTPSQRFIDEQSALSALPEQDFDTRYTDVRQVSWDAYIEVQGNRYSIPENWCHHTVRIRISIDGLLSVYAHEQLIAQHRLKSRNEGWQTVSSHHQALWQPHNTVEQRSLSIYEEAI